MSKIAVTKAIGSRSGSMPSQTVIRPVSIQHALALIILQRRLLDELTSESPLASLASYVGQSDELFPLTTERPNHCRDSGCTSSIGSVPGKAVALGCAVRIK